MEIAGHLNQAHNQVEEETAAGLKVPTEAEFAEALDPELSDDFIKVCGKEIKLKPLKIKYQLKLVTRVNRVLGHVGKSVAFGQAFKDTPFNDELLSKSIDHAMDAASDINLILEIIVAAAENDTIALTISDLEESDCSLLEFADFARKIVAKQNWGQEIKDFFGIEVPKLLKDLKEKGKGYLENAQASTEEQTTSTS